jgi:hypothetical protein
LVHVTWSSGFGCLRRSSSSRRHEKQSKKKKTEAREREQIEGEEGKAGREGREMVHAGRAEVAWTATASAPVVLGFLDGIPEVAVARRSRRR